MPRPPQKNVASAPPDAGDTDPGEGLGIDAILDRLEHAVRDLEGGELPLERALERFEQGVHLARRGNQMLDRVEQRVEMLLADRDQTVPLPSEADDDEDVP
jgi:exodeoxyribonuclease VII small subunit